MKKDDIIQNLKHLTDSLYVAEEAILAAMPADSEQRKEYCTKYLLPMMQLRAIDKLVKDLETP